MWAGHFPAAPALALLVLCQADFAGAAPADPPSQSAAAKTETENTATGKTNEAKTDAQTAKAVEVRTILQQGQTSSSMPSGLVVRIGACMGEADKSDPAKDKVEELVELWDAYRETDARDFGKLYAKLAERARSLFRE